MALKPITVQCDTNNKNIFALPAPGYVDAKTLTAAGGAESLTVPMGARFVVFSATGDFYANYTTTAAIPGDTADGSASELNPYVRAISGVTAISVIANADVILTAAFYL